MRSAGSGQRSTSGPQGHEYSAGLNRRISFSGESTCEFVSADPYCLDSDEAARPSQSPANSCRGPGRGNCETPRPQGPAPGGQYELYIPGAITGTNICLERLSLFLLHLYKLLSTLDLWLSVGGQEGAEKATALRLPVRMGVNRQTSLCAVWSISSRQHVCTEAWVCWWSGDPPSNTAHVRGG
jgi:hypothetical protein